ncbi:glycosyltransferase family 2 protein [Alloacidobacterium dinghuense]|uniref:Glycosyltransferase family 2 protein n=1 Tax=Alloacidobacterium dinghuense TaxID=2763107 RepID=A0A7G8BPZ3_9BACT|nr:glycosyltransferase family 2 protein [Alloacidobacterium dinghuense]QNI34613.1 glycosyltransferase family 2 protein [Alloacidobacterium dinghuense]
MGKPLSVAIITKNEEANLPRTLESVRWADEVVVVDSGSTDRTIEIASLFGAKVIREGWRGFGKQKNLAIEHCTSEWVLSLDADEEVSEALAQEITQLMEMTPDIHAYFVLRRNLFLDRWIRHGGYYPDPKLRLFRKGAAWFEERAVHETLRHTGPTRTLRGDLIHHAYPTIENYIEHMNRYSTLGAEQASSKNKTSRSWPAFLWNVLLNPAATFFYNYVLRLGFLDGREGLLLHLYHSAYVSWKYAKAWYAAKG